MTRAGRNLLGSIGCGTAGCPLCSLLGELETAFPGVCDHFDAVVAENGAAMLVDGEEIGFGGAVARLCAIAPS